MKHTVDKASHFVWRAARNLLCVTPWGRKLLFPSQSLATHFGRGDAEYAIRVFLHHHHQLSAVGFRLAHKILEVGPGRNVGTSLLMWALSYSRSGGVVTVILWDVFPNTVVGAEALREAAGELLASPAFHEVLDTLPDDGIDRTLGAVSRGELLPDIRYTVRPLRELIANGDASDFTLVYSQAAIEHIWRVADLWRGILSLTKTGGWHSHRIDLADHGRRESNYIEMLEWSPSAYWLTMRFVPGAINRWRASMHQNFVATLGLKCLSANWETRSALPIPLSRIHKEFRTLTDLDLRTTALDLVGIKTNERPMHCCPQDSLR